MSKLHDLATKRGTVQCQRGDIMEVTWLDACHTKNVKERDLGKNKTYATYTTTRGIFYDNLIDMRYHIGHLILIVNIKNNSYTITSIPMPCVMNINKKISRANRIRLLANFKHKLDKQFLSGQWESALPYDKLSKIIEDEKKCL